LSLKVFIRWVFTALASYQEKSDQPTDDSVPLPENVVKDFFLAGKLKDVFYQGTKEAIFFFVPGERNTTIILKYPSGCL